MFKDIKESVENKITMHNHPNGNIFSEEDIKFAVVNKTRETCIVKEKDFKTGNKVVEKLKHIKRSHIKDNFANDYAKFATDYKINTIDNVWKNSNKDAKAAKKCNLMMYNFREKWLKDNAERYGYKYERKEY